MSRLIRLIPPSGCDEANADGRAFHKHDDGFFYVDEQYIGPLLHVGGFALAPDVDPPAAPVEPRPVSIGDVEALARKLPVGDLKAQLLGAIAAVAQAAPRQTVKLVAHKGVDGFSHAGERFDCDPDGFVEAPIEAVDSLTHGAGFAVVPDNPSPLPPVDDLAEADEPEAATSAPPVDEAESAPPPSAWPRLIIPSIPIPSLSGAGFG